MRDGSCEAGAAQTSWRGVAAARLRTSTPSPDRRPAIGKATCEAPPPPPPKAPPARPPPAGEPAPPSLPSITGAIDSSQGSVLQSLVTEISMSHFRGALHFLMIWIFLPLALEILPRTLAVLAIHVQQPHCLSRSLSSARPARRPFSAREAAAVLSCVTAVGSKPI